MSGDRHHASPPARLLLRLDMDVPAIESSPTGLLSVAEIEHLRRASLVDFDSVDGDDEEEEITTVIARLPSDAPPSDPGEVFVASLPKPPAAPSVRLSMSAVAPPRPSALGTAGPATFAPPPPPSSEIRAVTPPPNVVASKRLLGKTTPMLPAVAPRPPVLQPASPTPGFPPGDSVFPAALAPRESLHPAALTPTPGDVTQTPVSRARVDAMPSAYGWSIPQPTFQPLPEPRRSTVPRWAKVYFAFVTVVFFASVAGWLVTR